MTMTDELSKGREGRMRNIKHIMQEKGRTEEKGIGRPVRNATTAKRGDILRQIVGRKEEERKAKGQKGRKLGKAKERMGQERVWLRKKEKRRMVYGQLQTRMRCLRTGKVTAMRRLTGH